MRWVSVGLVVCVLLSLFGCGREPEGPSDEEWTARLNEVACRVPHVTECELTYRHVVSGLSKKGGDPRVRGKVRADSDDKAVLVAVLDKVAREVAGVLADDTSTNNMVGIGVANASRTSGVAMREIEGLDDVVSFDELTAHYGLVRKKR